MAEENAFIGYGVCEFNYGYHDDNYGVFFD